MLVTKLAVSIKCCWKWFPRRDLHGRDVPRTEGDMTVTCGSGCCTQQSPDSVHGGVGPFIQHSLHFFCLRAYKPIEALALGPDPRTWCLNTAFMEWKRWRTPGEGWQAMMVCNTCETSILFHWKGVPGSAFRILTFSLSIGDIIVPRPVGICSSRKLLRGFQYCSLRGFWSRSLCGEGPTWDFVIDE